MELSTRFIGLDVHKATIGAAMVPADDRGKAMPLGVIPNTTAALEKLVKRLRASTTGALKFCYEAGPCGYGVHRTLVRLGEDCMVVAPSLIPRRAGDRQKNDKRDAANLAVLHKSGLLTPVWVADTAHEAMRDLIRARLAAVRAVRTARQQLSAFLLRHERVWPGDQTTWTKAHRRWLADQRFEQPAQHIVLEESIEAVRLAEQRRDRVGAAVRSQNRGLVAGPVGAKPVRVARPGRDRRRRHRRRHWRRGPVPIRGRLHGVSWPGALRTLIRSQTPHGRDYQKW